MMSKNKPGLFGFACNGFNGWQPLCGVTRALHKHSQIYFKKIKYM